MKRNPRTTDYYNEHLCLIDEQICSLLKQRKVLSNNNPGIPTDELISNWAEKYDFSEIYLYQLFGAMQYEHIFKTRIEPTGFKKYLSVSKSIEINERFHSISTIRQYENASVIQLQIDWDETENSSFDIRKKHCNNTFELYLGDQYDCWLDRSQGSTGHYTYNFNVSPPLPDDISGFSFVFKEYHDTLKEKPTGLEITIQIN